MPIKYGSPEGQDLVLKPYRRVSFPFSPGVFPALPFLFARKKRVEFRRQAAVVFLMAPRVRAFLLLLTGMLPSQLFYSPFVESNRPTELSSTKPLGQDAV